MKKLFLLLLTVFTLSLCASAQTRVVKGAVVDAETGEEIIGASVQAGPGYGIATDINGFFSLKVPATTTSITVSYTGYETQTVPVSDSDLTIRLVQKNELLDEVMVVAYGVQTKSSFTGSAATVNSATIEKTQVSNPLNALSGRVTGMQMSNASGNPTGSDPAIAVRGVTSVTGAANPLIIVDGTPFTGGMNSINTADIESMTVLKDAASAALYGARGANGVILITTKRAKLGEAKVTLDAKWGLNMRGTQDYNYITNPAQYYELYYKSLYNYAAYGSMGLSPADANAWANANITASNAFGLYYNVFTLPEGQNLIGLNGKLNPNATLGRMVEYKGEQFWLYPDDWLDYTYKNSLRQEYNLSVTQGTDKSNIVASIGFLNNQGIVIAPSSLSRFSGRLAADFQAKPWLKVGASADYAHLKMVAMGSEGESTSTGNIFAFATQIPPIYPLFMRDGNKQIMVDAQGFQRYDYGGGLNGGLRRPNFTGSNAISDALLNENSTEENQFRMTAFAEIRFLKDFKLTLNNNANVDEWRSTSVQNPYYGQFAPQNGIVSKSHSRDVDYTFQQLLNWNHTFGDHSIEVLAGHEYYKNLGYSLSGQKTNMFLPSNTELAGAIIDVTSNSSVGMYNNEGWLFRAQYNYDNKYFASGSFRRDASSRFHPKHRWGNFWSLGGAWLINKEDFFDVDWINLLKIKVSYGEQGNDNIGNYRYVDVYSLINSNGYPALTPSSKGNENITWEKNGNLNAGVEFGMFNNRLNGQVDIFHRMTRDMLMYFPLPASFGFMGYYDNIGNMTNTGVEIELSGDIIRTRELNWNITANFTWYKNVIASLPEERKLYTVDGVNGYSSGNYYYGEGRPMYTFYMKRYLGVDKETGLPLYEKKTLDGQGNETGEKTTTTDYAQATNALVGGALAPIYGGFQTSLDYKGFDLTLMFNYQIGGLVYDSAYASLMSSPSGQGTGSNMHADLYDAWTPDNKNSNTPRFFYGDVNSASTSSRFLTNASYLSLENINFGYTLPNSLVKKMYLSKLRVYFACENVWLWSKRQGLNPRQSFTGGSSNAYNSAVRTLSGGLSVTF